MAKIVLALLVLCMVASALAVGGSKDILGNYYDYTTGQVSSSLTGKVYNTVPSLHHGAYLAAPAYHGAYLAAPAYHGAYLAAPAYHGAYAAAPAYHAPLVYGR